MAMNNMHVENHQNKKKTIYHRCMNIYNKMLYKCTKPLDQIINLKMF